MSVSVPQLRNIVVHLKVPLDEEVGRNLSEFKKLGQRARKRGGGGDRLNFFVRKEEGQSFTVFPKSGDVIITGISRPEEARRAFRTLSRRTGRDVSYLLKLPRKLTNSTYSGTVGGYPSLSSPGGSASACEVLAAYEKSKRGRADASVSVSFRSQFFPGARVRFAGLGTVNLFNNGKYVMVGVRDPRNARVLREKLCAIMRTSLTT